MNWTRIIQYWTTRLNKKPLTLSKRHEKVSKNNHRWWHLTKRLSRRAKRKKNLQAQNVFEYFLSMPLGIFARRAGSTSGFPTLAPDNSWKFLLGNQFSNSKIRDKTRYGNSDSNTKNSSYLIKKSQIWNRKAKKC